MVLTLDACGYGSCQPLFFSGRGEGRVGSGKGPATSRCLEEQAEPGVHLAAVPQPSSPQNSSRSKYFCIPERAHLNPRDPGEQSDCRDVPASHYHPLNGPKQNHRSPLERPGVSGLPRQSSKDPPPVTLQRIELHMGKQPLSLPLLKYLISVGLGVSLSGRVHAWHAWYPGLISSTTNK